MDSGSLALGVLKHLPPPNTACQRPGRFWPRAFGRSREPHPTGSALRGSGGRWRPGQRPSRRLSDASHEPRTRHPPLRLLRVIHEEAAWRRRPGAGASAAPSRSVTISRWTDPATHRRRFSREIESGYHTVGINLRDTTVDFSVAGRTIHSGRVPAGALQISGPGDLVAAELSAPSDALRLYGAVPAARGMLRVGSRPPLCGRDCADRPALLPRPRHRSPGARLARRGTDGKRPRGPLRGRSRARDHRPAARSPLELLSGSGGRARRSGSSNGGWREPRTSSKPILEEPSTWPTSPPQRG